MRLGIVPVRCPNELLAIGTEHRKPVKGRRGCNLLHPGAVRIDEEEIEISQLRIGMMVGRDNDLPPVRRPRWPRARGTLLGDLPRVAAVGVHHPRIHFVRTTHPLR